MGVKIHYNKLMKVKSEWSMKTSQEMWLLLRHFITFLYRLTFSPITDRNYQVTWKTWFCPITYAITLLSTLYTIYIRRHELLATMCDFCISGLLLTASIHFYSIIGPDRFEYQRLIFFGEEYIFLKLQTGDMEKLLQKHANILLRNICILAIILLIATTIFYTIPVYMYLVLGQLQPLLPHRFPFLDMHTPWGYAITFVVHVEITFCVTIPNVGHDCTFAMILSSFAAGVDLIKYSLNELSEILTKQGAQIDVARKAKLRNILIQTQDLERLIIRWKFIFSAKFFWQPVLIAASVSISIFSNVIRTAPPIAYSYVVFVFGELLLLCYLGDQINLKREDLLASLYSIPWYLLPLKEQYYILNILNATQNGRNLTIGTLAELNFETATKITKIIYTYLMTLLRMVKN